MSEDSGDKAFKPLKLTSLKSAKSAVAPAADAGAGAPATESPASATPAATPAAAAATSALKPFKLPLTTRGSGVAPVEPDGGPGLAQGAPALNPLNISVEAPDASAGARSVAFKPLSVNSPASVSTAPQAGSPGTVVGGEVFSAALSSSPSLAVSGGVSASVPAPVPPPLPGLNSLAKKSPVPKAPAGPASSVKTVGRRLPKPVLAAVVVVIAIAIGAYFMRGSPVAPVDPVRPSTGPVRSPEPAVSVNPDPVETVPDPVKPAAPVTPAPGTTGASEAAPIRSRKAELEVWLKSAVLSTVSSRRIALNDRAYSLNDAVNPEGTLRWIGRDSVTRDLLFMDEDGVVYTKPSLASPR